MYIIFLEFTEQKSRASAFMPAHNDWVKAGFDQGYFLLVGGLEDNQGGAILAQSPSRDVLEAFVGEDPFVKEAIVCATIKAVHPGRVDERLDFLKVA